MQIEIKQEYVIREYPFIGGLKVFNYEGKPVYLLAEISYYDEKKNLVELAMYSLSYSQKGDLIKSIEKTIEKIKNKKPDEKEKTIREYESNRKKGWIEKHGYLYSPDGKKAISMVYAPEFNQEKNGN
jgi:predicted ribosome quality control (RQC) complex YloA/Tae2 family protein